MTGRVLFSQFLAVSGHGKAFDLTHVRFRVPSVVHSMRWCGVCLLLGLVLVASCRLHSRPDAPAVPVGPDSVNVDSTYTFSSWMGDSNNGKAFIRFDWDDGDTSLWHGSDDTVECSHSWKEGGIFLVRAQARGDRDELSEWSAPCSVTAVFPPYPYRLVDSAMVIDAPLLDAQVSPNGEFVYVTNDWSGALSVVRTADMRLAAQIHFNGGWSSSGQVVCSPDGRYVYATCYTDNDWVAVVRAADHVVVDSLMLGAEVTGLAISPDGQRLYLAVDADSSIIVVARVPDNVIDDTIFAPGIWGYTTSLKVAPDGSHLFAGSLETGDIYAIDLTDNTLEWRAFIYGNSAPGAIALHPTGNPLYVVADDLAVLESGTGSLVTSIPVSSFMWSAEVSPDGSFLYVTCGDGDHDGAVAVVRTSDNAVVRVIAMPDDVYDVAASPDGQRLYVACDNGKLYVLSR